MLTKLVLIVSLISLSTAGIVMSAATPRAKPAQFDSCCAPCPHCAEVCKGDCEVCGCEFCTAK